MEYKTIQFEVVETTNPFGWKWVVFLDATESGPGLGLPALTPCWMLNWSSTRCWRTVRTLAAASERAGADRPALAPVRCY